ncbi:sensor histidine kinase [Thalassococcus sp. CAU 1522]|uniref:histidine kinase n=1 Tax=Thalassococcus arenae TaxID=2851652 RepID=A0ABS6N9H0_9RHOB|nr:ATP-binding protein [Thalassococcus arenae]MBV2360661.1 sensor histidine kinase [Thalassococcus arenae]
MTRKPVHPALLLALFLTLTAALGGAVWRYGYGQALDQVAARGQSDLALAADRLVTQLRRYREFAVLMAEHPVLSPLHDGAEADQAAAVLQGAVDKIGPLAAFYADPAGRVLASSAGPVPEGLREAPYFKRALNGALGAAHGPRQDGRGRTYSFAAPTFRPDGRVRGVLVVVADIESLEQDWRASVPSVYFLASDDSVFVTNRSEILGWRDTGAGRMALPDGSQQAATIRQFQGHTIWRQDFSRYIPAQALHLVQDLPVIDMTGVALVDVAPAQRLALLQAAVVMAVCLVFGAALWLVTERRRVLAAANAVLEERVSARTRALERTNMALRREVHEREEAEAALKRAQAELVQAGKLSALGQMSAGISHELNQPLMAIRQYADNGASLLDKGRTGEAGQNLRRISDMAARAARIIKNLRAFARNESEPMGRVDLVAVIDSAAELTEARLRSEGVVLDWRPGQTSGPVWARGGEVRLTQVFVNLINNAADAMTGQQNKRIDIALQRGAKLVVTVRDVGPGIADPERVFEPFYTTKAVGSGDGMGLGLSISYGLVQSFGGNIRGSNTENGAMFTVELDPWQEEVAA